MILQILKNDYLKKYYYDLINLLNLGYREGTILYCQDFIAKSLTLHYEYYPIPLRTKNEVNNNVWYN